MKYIILTILLTCAFIPEVTAQIHYKIASRALKTEVIYDTGNKGITVQWKRDTSAFFYIIRRKLVDDTAFHILDTLEGLSTEYYDPFAEHDKITEYSVIKKYKYSLDTLRSYAYPVTGKLMPAKHYRGAALVLVDYTVYDSLKFELDHFRTDLMGDGWRVYIEKSPRAETFSAKKVFDTKDIILSYSEIDTSLEAVLLFGRIPVPYSGDIAPDGHGDHYGAWPADLYYGELDGLWRDDTTNFQVASDQRNHNVPGDGKFDNIFIPSDVDLQVGRVDLYNLPFFDETEIELLRNYLEKDHKYRNGSMNVVDSAIVNDMFGNSYIEAFSAGGLLNFYNLFDDRINTEDKLRFAIQDENRNFKWTYGCGPGSYISAHDIAYSEEFADTNQNAVFSLIFGSYHGDWDSENNLLRSALASKPSILMSAWSGRPTWMFQHVLYGETIGYSARFTQNYYPDEYPSMSLFGSRFTYVGLMGDPTLRNDVVQPVANLRAESVDQVGVKLTWEYDDFNEGFYVYKSLEPYGDFLLLDEEPVYLNEFTDPKPIQGMNYYMVRTRKLEEHHYGSYYNLSTGKFIGEFFNYTSVPDYTANASDQFELYPNPAVDKINLRLNIPVSNELTLRLYNIQGTLVNSMTLSGNSSKGIELKSADGTALANGYYTVEIKSGNINVKKKLMIVN